MKNGDDGNRKDFWDKFSILSGFLAVVFVPLALGLAGHWYAEAVSQRGTNLQERETSLKEQEFARQWVQISLDILRSEGNRGEESLRLWAVSVIDHYTHPDIKMEDPLREALATGRSVLPAGDRVQRLEAMQTAALQALLERDINGAIAHMEAAHREWHDFRTVWETLRLLRERRAALAPDDDAAWSALYSELISRMDMRGVAYSVREQLRSGG